MLKNVKNVTGKKCHLVTFFLSLFFFVSVFTFPLPPCLPQAGSSKEAREVRQFHFTSWPDHGVPQYATAMLSMLRRVQAYHGTDTSPSPSPSPNPSPSPMLIHCSAGWEGGRERGAGGRMDRQTDKGADNYVH